MERPFAVVGISALCALIFSVFLDTAARIAMMALCAAVLVILILWKKKDAFRGYLRMSAALFTVLLAFFAYELKLQLAVEPAANLAGTTARITAQVTDYPAEQYGKFYYILDVQEVVTEEEVLETGGFRTRMSSSTALYCEPGDRIETEVTFYGYSDTFGFSSKSSYAAKGIPVACYQTRYGAKVLEHSGGSTLLFFAKLRKELSGNASVMLPGKEASLVRAMLLGDRGGISPEVDDSFRQSGITHLLVVSGLHMSMVSGIILGFLSLLRLPRRVKNPLAILATIVFMLLSGLSVSVLRSGIMMIIFLAADLFGREPDALNSLGIAIFAMCVVNPLIGGDIGYLLSVFATMGIIVLSAPLQKFFLRPFRRFPRFSGKINGIASGFAAGISASLFILPLQVYLFGNISLMGPFATVLLSLPCTAMMYMAVLSLLLFSVPGLQLLAEPFAYLCGMLCRLILNLADWLSQWTVFSLNTGSTYALLPLCGALCLTAVLILRRPERLTKILAPVLTAMMVILSVALYAVKYDGSVVVAVPDQGEDSCVVVTRDAEAAVLSLGGYNTSAADSILRDRNIRTVSSVFIWDDQPQETEALMNLLKRYPVGCIYLPQEYYVDRQLRAVLRDTPYVFYEEKLQYDAMKNFPVEFGSGGAMRFVVSGRTVLLETGAAEGGNCDILFTNNAESRVNSPFTVLQSDDIIIPVREVSSQYIFACENRVTYFDFLSDGSLNIRGEE